MTTTTQDAPATLNWVFLHQPHHPRRIHIPRTLFDESAQDCRKLFATALLDEFAYQAEARTVEFWKVSSLPESLLLAQWKLKSHSLHRCFRRLLY